MEAMARKCSLIEVEAKCRLKLHTVLGKFVMLLLLEDIKNSHVVFFPSPYPDLSNEASAV